MPVRNVMLFIQTPHPLKRIPLHNPIIMSFHTIVRTSAFIVFLFFSYAACNSNLTFIEAFTVASSTWNKPTTVNRMTGWRRIPKSCYESDRKSFTSFLSSSSLMLSSNDDNAEDPKSDASSSVDEVEVEVGTSDETEKKLNVARKIWRRMFPPKQDADGLTVGQKLAKMGFSVLLSYGFVSNMSYSVSVSLAWYVFSKQTGVSPLAKGQWPKFLAVYAGFYVFNNVIRPVRITLSAYVASYFDRMVKATQEKFHCKKGVAISIIVFFFNIVGTLSAMSAGITLASIASGVPIWTSSTAVGAL